MDDNGPRRESAELEAKTKERKKKNQYVLVPLLCLSVIIAVRKKTTPVATDSAKKESTPHRQSKPSEAYLAGG